MRVNLIKVEVVNIISRQCVLPVLWQEKYCSQTSVAFKIAFVLSHDVPRVATVYRERFDCCSLCPL